MVFLSLGNFLGIMALTKYREGSVGELWTISLPLMISFFSTMFMIFMDRTFLAHYSTEAFNAAVSASTMGWGFMVGFMALGSISEVFVSQYNGAGRHEMLGRPVWQMLWVGLLSIFFFFPLTYWGTELIFPGQEEQMQRIYFRWMCYFGPAVALYGALAGFFVGQGKTLLITTVSVSANIVNIGLDWTLIFGIQGYLAPMGVKGAALATSASSIFQMLALFVVFMSPYNRKHHHTGNWCVDLPLMRKCLRIGIPGSVFVTIEIVGWGIYYVMMARAGFVYITIAGIAQSIAILFLFFAEAVSKGATVIAGNMIGSRHNWNIPNLLYSGIGLHLTFFICLGAIFAVATDPIIQLFLPNISPDVLEELYWPLTLSIFLILVYLFFEGVRFLISGILTAYGDTMFIFVAGASSIWLFLLIPVWIAVFQFGASIVIATLISVAYAALASLIYYWRFLEERWQNDDLISTE